MSAESEAVETIYYSARDCGFLFLAERPAYDAAGTWPEDAVEVTPDEWAAFGQVAPPAGMRRGSDAQGRPAWIWPTVSVADAVEQERGWRDRQLSVTDALVARHRDQEEAGRATTLTAEEYKSLQGYRLDLRDWPVSPGFPDLSRRPSPPSFLTTE